LKCPGCENEIGEPSSDQGNPHDCESACTNCKTVVCACSVIYNANDHTFCPDCTIENPFSRTRMCVVQPDHSE
jgi:hypothetical protein